MIVSTDVVFVPPHVTLSVRDVVLPTAAGRDLRLRCVVRPDKAQADLLGRLGLDLPERLRVQETPEM